MRAGQLDRRVTIQTRSNITRPSGATVQGWTNVGGRRPARQVPVRGQELNGLPQAVASQQVEWRVRYAAALLTLSPLSRLIYPAITDAEAGDPNFEPAVGRIFDIQVVGETERREGLSIMTLRRSDVPS